jgi:hypothetical protein
MAAARGVGAPSFPHFISGKGGAVGFRVYAQEPQATQWSEGPALHHVRGRPEPGATL